MRTYLFSVLGLALLAVLAIATFQAPDAAAGDPSCRDQGLCVGTGCIPIPTSLPTVNGPRAQVEGWAPGPTKCGIKRCYVILSCACGSPLGVDFCDGCDWPPECV